MRAKKWWVCTLTVMRYAHDFFLNGKLEKRQIANSYKLKTAPFTIM